LDPESTETHWNQVKHLPVLADNYLWTGCVVDLTLRAKPYPFIEL